MKFVVGNNDSPVYDRESASYPLQLIYIGGPECE